MNKPFESFSNTPAASGAAMPRWAPPAAVFLAAAFWGWSGSVACPDSLWKDGQARPLVSDKRALAVGDILSILVQENNSATKDSNTKTSKKSDVDASIAAFLYSPGASSLLTQKGQMPALKYSAKNDFDGGGKINNSERILARVAVQVAEVLPNQNLVIEGRRRTSFSGESQEIVLRGVVRPADILPNNTLYSYNVADATIQFVSKGTVSDAQRKGWFTKLWDKLTPF
jgi:flagellar L-ring protein precursor FlgH